MRRLVSLFTEKCFVLTFLWSPYLCQRIRTCWWWFGIWILMVFLSRGFLIFYEEDFFSFCILPLISCAVCCFLIQRIFVCLHLFTPNWRYQREIPITVLPLGKWPSIGQTAAFLKRYSFHSSMYFTETV